MIATTEVSAIRLGHAAAHAGPAVDADAKPTKMRHLCKNMQTAVQNTASRLFAAIGISGPSLSLTTPVSEGSITRVHITHHHLVPVPAIEPTFVIKAGDAQGGLNPDAHKDDHLRGPFLHRVHYALMSLGPWEGRIVAFVLGCGIGVLLRMFWVLAVLLVRAFRGTPAPEEDIIFVYTEDVAPPYRENDEKKAIVIDTEENRA
ncbi:hypothetical protein BJV78DRAFT_658455 [Lactifluus subvellereus]|nr:hypothetical protein BJV78DRAFT_658455 [Lactifluus subvellereus]